MKMSRISFALVCVVAALSSCQKVDEAVKRVPMVFDAGSETVSDAADSKIALDSQNQFSVVWQKGDEISVFDGYANNKFTVNPLDSGKVYASFTGDAIQPSNYTSKNKYFALYPYRSTATCSGTAINGVAINEQQAGVSGQLSPKSTVMYAETVNNDTDFRFKHVCAYLKITTTLEYNKIVVTSLDSDMPLSSTVNISLDSNKVPNWQSVNGDKTTVTLGTDIAAGTYYAAVLPNNYTSGLTITLFVDDTHTTTYKISSANLLRGKVYPITLQPKQAPV